MRVQVQPLPAPEKRNATQIRGVVLRAAEAQRIEFARVDNVAWTDSMLALTGVLRTDASSTAVTTRSFALSSLSGVLVREVDADRTSILIAAVGVGTVVIATFLLTGKTDENTMLQGLRGR
jgi:hypothetical protein